MLSCCLTIIFSKLTFSKTSFKYTFKGVKKFDPDQASHFIGPDLCPNCLQMLSGDLAGRAEFLYPAHQINEEERGGSVI